jgi:6-pyruvoyltetrahydropterin/6-carboxytetrahydropterin synthase
MERFLDFTFVAAQRLPNVGDAHRAAVLHGHTFTGTVRVSADMDRDAGWLIDPADMKREVDAVLGAVDHQFLNELPDLENPSTENLCGYLRDRLAGRLPGRVEVELWENPAVGCTTQGPRT